MPLDPPRRMLPPLLSCLAMDLFEMGKYHSATSAGIKIGGRDKSIKC